MENDILTFPSALEGNDIAYYIYTPSTPVVCIVQIIHGMYENIKKYRPVISYLNDNGILVCGADLLGHGKSVKTEDDKWYFGEDGTNNLVSDVETLRTIMRKRYRATPYFMLGHSFGSFILRKYITEYGSNIDGAVIIGTSGKLKNLGFGIWLCNLLSKIKGERYRSRLVQFFTFGTYNRRFKDEKNPSSWTTTDPEKREHYKKSALINNFTLNGYKTLFLLLKEINGEEWAASVPTGLPLFIASGSEDPVGEYSVGVQRVADALQNAEIYDLTYRIYDGMRHELYSDVRKEEFLSDLLEWIMKTRQGVLEDRGVLM